MPIIDAFFRPADILFPLKWGGELFIDGRDAKVNERLQFRFNVALNEPGSLKVSHWLKRSSNSRD